MKEVDYRKHTLRSLPWFAVAQCGSFLLTIKSYAFGKRETQPSRGITGCDVSTVSDEQPITARQVLNEIVQHTPFT